MNYREGRIILANDSANKSFSRLLMDLLDGTWIFYPVSFFAMKIHCKPFERNVYPL
ncbi:MAG: hypothetical protein IM548_00940 [Chitinophagaceae bacterium]|nr:hypothetical protein [Chitinophagaceae bacterium]